MPVIGLQAEQGPAAKAEQSQVDSADKMPVIPQPSTQAAGDPSPEGDVESAERQAERQQAEAERRERAEEEIKGMQPWASGQSILALDRIRRLLEHLDDAGFLFKSSLRRFLKVSTLLSLPV